MCSPWCSWDSADLFSHALEFHLCLLYIKLKNPIIKQASWSYYDTAEPYVAYAFILYIPLETNKYLASQTSILYSWVHMKLFALGAL